MEDKLVKPILLDVVYSSRFIILSFIRFAESLRGVRAIKGFDGIRISSSHSPQVLALEGILYTPGSSEYSDETICIDYLDYSTAPFINRILGMHRYYGTLVPEDQCNEYPCMSEESFSVKDERGLDIIQGIVYYHDNLNWCDKVIVTGINPSTDFRLSRITAPGGGIGIKDSLFLLELGGRNRGLYQESLFNRDFTPIPMTCNRYSIPTSVGSMIASIQECFKGAEVIDPSAFIDKRSEIKRVIV